MSTRKHLYEWIVYCGKGSGRGPAPTHRFICITVVYIYWRIHIAIYCNVLTHNKCMNRVLNQRARLRVMLTIVFAVVTCAVLLVTQRSNDLCAQSMVIWPYDPVPRRLGAGGALTVLRFALLARLRPVLGFNARLECVLSSWVWKVQIVEPETAKKEGDFRGGYLLHFSTVSGVVRA